MVWGSRWTRCRRPNRLALLDSYAGMTYREPMAIWTACLKAYRVVAGDVGENRSATRRTCLAKVLKLGTNAKTKYSDHLMVTKKTNSEAKGNSRTES